MIFEWAAGINFHCLPYAFLPIYDSANSTLFITKPQQRNQKHAFNCFLGHTCSDLKRCCHKKTGGLLHLIKGSVDIVGSNCKKT